MPRPTVVLRDLEQRLTPKGLASRRETRERSDSLRLRTSRDARVQQLVRAVLRKGMRELEEGNPQHVIAIMHPTPADEDKLVDGEIIIDAPPQLDSSLRFFIKLSKPSKSDLPIEGLMLPVFDEGGRMRVQFLSRELRTRLRKSPEVIRIIRNATRFIQNVKNSDLIRNRLGAMTFRFVTYKRRPSFVELYDIRDI